jgi:hypothetical protein
VSSVVLGPGIIIENYGNLVQQPGLPLSPKSISTVLSIYSVNKCKETHKNHIFIVPNAAGIFFFIDKVALNFFAGGDDGCLHIMDALLILLVARLNLISSCIKMH